MIQRVSAFAAIALAGVTLAACHHGGGAAYGSTNGNLCKAFPSHDANTPAIAANDAAGAYDDCLHRWAYSLAPARDSAEIVAGAATAACAAALDHWNQQTLNQQAAPGPVMPGQAQVPVGGAEPSQYQPGADQPGTDLGTGQPTDLITARSQFAQNRALFYVVQARAGGCAPPPGKPPVGEP